jgi:hypothetical protein
MSNEPILYDSREYEHANVAVLFCQEVLKEQGLAVEASQLEGIDVSSAPMARVALRVLQNMQVDGAAEEAVAVATHLCQHALGFAKVRAAG